MGGPTGFCGCESPTIPGSPTAVGLSEHSSAGTWLSLMAIAGVTIMAIIAPETKAVANAFLALLNGITSFP